MKLSTILKKKQKKLRYLSRYLKKEQYLLSGFYPHLQTRNLDTTKNKTEDYVNGKIKLVITCNTCKIQSLFNYKDKVQYHSCVIYRGVCSCGADKLVRPLEIPKLFCPMHPKIV